MLHRLATPQSEDVEIFEEADPAFFIAIRADAARPRGDDLGPRPRRVGDACRRSRRSRRRAAADRAAPARLPLRGDGSRRRLLHSRPTAAARADFHIVVAPREAPEEANWRPFVPHKAGRLIERAALFKDFLVLLAREDNVPRLVVHELAERERARDRLRGADLHAGARAGLRVRFAGLPLQLRLDGLQPGDLRLRRRRTASASCARSRRRRRTSTPRPMSRAASSPAPTTARACRSRSSIAATSSSTAARRC